MTFSGEVNITTLLVFLSGALAWYLTVVRLGDRVKITEGTVALMKKESESINIALQAARAEHQVFKEEVYKEYLSRTVFGEIESRQHENMQAMEGRLLQSIHALGERVDKLSGRSPLKN